jgi:predicted Fe-Mo cluster-binding NifX family protein
MKVLAIPSRGTEIEDHFGQCENYTIIKVSDNKVISKEEFTTPQGCGCKSGLAGILADKGVGFMIAGSMGQGALNHLNAAGIEVMCGFSGNIDDAVEKHLKGYNGDKAVCQHHGHHHHHGHGHECNH